MPALPPYQKPHYSKAVKCIEELAMFLKPSQNAQLSRPMQRKLVTLVNCQLLEVEGRARAARAARSLGERSVTELILQHQNPQQLSANLWAAVRARGCQFLGRYELWIQMPVPVIEWYFEEKVVCYLFQPHFSTDCSIFILIAYSIICVVSKMTKTAVAN